MIPCRLVFLLSLNVFLLMRKNRFLTVFRNCYLVFFYVSVYSSRGEQSIIMIWTYSLFYKTVIQTDAYDATNIPSPAKNRFTLFAWDKRPVWEVSFWQGEARAADTLCEFQSYVPLNFFSFIFFEFLFMQPHLKDYPHEYQRGVFT